MNYSAYTSDRIITCIVRNSNKNLVYSFTNRTVFAVTVKYGIFVYICCYYVIKQKCTNIRIPLAIYDVINLRKYIKDEGNFVRETK